MKIPNYLTIGRIIIVPIFVFAFYLPGFYGDVIPFALFVIASFTDFLDGLLARMFKEESKLGELLDPIADKVLVVFALIAVVMLANDSNVAIMASLILAREFWVSGLREQSARNKTEDVTKVTFLAKIKTTVQFVAISLYFYSAAANLAL